MTSTNILVLPQSPFSSFSLSLPSHLPILTLSTVLTPLCPRSQQSLSLLSGRSLPSPSLPLSTLKGDKEETVWVRLAVRLPGGKGGFASQLRAQGGRMSSNKATNTDSCRDLNGRRLSTIKEAQKLATYISKAADREAAATKQAIEKLKKLEDEVARLGGGSGSTAGESSTGIKRRLEDHEYVEQSKEIVDGVRDAVKAAMLKKRKKNKPLSPTGDTSAQSATSLEVGSSSNVAKKIPEAIATA